MINKVTVTLTALFLVALTLASGYIVGAVREAYRPAEPVIMPLCSRWGFMQPAPHKPGTTLKCRIADIQMNREDI